MPMVCVEDCLAIDVHRMVTHALGDGHAGLWHTWQWTGGGKVTATIGYSADRCDVQGTFLSLRYSTGGKPITDHFRLQARPCRYGGVRWYAECHHTRRSVAKLYLPPGAAHFRARQAWRVAYRSQNVAAGLSRLCFRRDRYLRRKLNDADPFLLLRPRGMRWHTYQWHMQKIDALHLAIDREMMRRFGVHAPF